MPADGSALLWMADLTKIAIPHKLPAVQRLLAAVVAVAMLSASGSAALQHVHAYLDHDHPDHLHGPASHGHSAVGHSHAQDSHAEDAHTPGEVAQFEGCDPGEHAVSVVSSYVAPQPEHPPVPTAADAVIVAPPERTGRYVAACDVRVHSPPRLTDAPLRAPPVVFLA